MRDPARIDRILAQLREAWIQVPDWRLGQLILNSLNSFEQRASCPELFAIEDDKLERLIAATSSGLSKMLEARQQDP
jgi:hypothetical protein